MHLEKVVGRIYFEERKASSEDYVVKKLQRPQKVTIAFLAIFNFWAIGLFLVKINPLVLAAILVVFMLVFNKFRLPPNLRRFLRQNRAEMRDLTRRVRQFNSALEADEKATELLESPVKKHEQTMKAEWLEKCHSSLETEVDNFLDRHADAAGVDYEHFRKRHPPNPKREFKQKVRRLQQLEKSLAELNFDPRHADKPNVHSCLTAKYLRQQLEQERRDLGLPESALPPRRVKLL